MLTGLETIAESERKGRPSGLFWPWFAANVSVLAISYGSYLLGFGISIWQAIIAGVVGTILSFVLPLLAWSAVSYVPFLWHPLVQVSDPGAVDYEARQSFWRPRRDWRD